MAATLKNIFSTFGKVGGDLTGYLNNDNEQNTAIVSLLKQVFEYSKKDEEISERIVDECPLNKLETEDFDDEQLWQQIQLQNEALLRQSVKRLKHLAKGEPILWLNEKNGVEMLQDEDNEAFQDGDIDDDNHDIDDVIDDDNHDIDDVIDDDHDIDDQMIDHKNKFKNNNVKQRTSIVDDQFFKLSEMEEFLEMVERNGEKEKDDDEEDDDVDLFIDYNKENEVTSSKVPIRPNDSKDASNYMYEDFYDTPDGVSKTNDKEEDNRMTQGPSMDDNDYDDHDDDDAINNDDVVDDNDDVINDNDDVINDNDDVINDNDDVINDNDDVVDDNAKCEVVNQPDNDGNKSTFEKYLNKVKRKIVQLENSNISSKPWQLVGETSGSVRPQNSLLQEMLYFDHTTAAAPIVTEETSLQLEDIIIQRIKDQTWDDVERKKKTVKEPYTYKKDKPLSQEKSKMSLSEIYEKEYLAQKEPAAEKTDEGHEKIEKMTTALFTKLDALSNFHFAPKPLKSEVTIIANVGSVAIEEPTPVTVSETNLLAPEEIFDKVELKGETEQTKEDRKHDRRLKKKRQSLAAKEKNKLKDGLGNKYTKEKIKKLKNTEAEGTEDKKSFSSSSAFFAKLQDSVRNEIHEKTNVVRKKRNTLQSAQVRL